MAVYMKKLFLLVFQNNKKSNSVVIGNNCWIGANAIILPEIELGDNCIIGAGAFVTKSFPANYVIAGNPAKLYER
ncbi:MAG: hypothetical protein KAW92_07885 [Candidatus Cloacimonetes bacterium]|nr:hypothetical protein [Candidatus Cloacimonadota bacterium]